MSERRASHHTFLSRCLAVSLMLIGLLVAPSWGSPADAYPPLDPTASSRSLDSAASAALGVPRAGVGAAKVPVPADVAALVAKGPADIIVGIDPAPGMTAAQPTAAAPTTASPGAVLPTAAERQAGADRAAAAFGRQKNTVLAHTGSAVRTVRDWDALPVQLLRVDSPAALAALAAAPGVTSLAVPAARRAAVDTDLALIRQPQAQQAGFTGAGVVVAVLDTGVDYRLAGVGGAFGDCRGGPGTGSCRIDHLVDVTRTGVLDIDTGGHHGTNVSGVVAKTAPGAHLDVYGVFDSDLSAWDDDIISALNAVARTGAARNVRAVNLSLGDASFHVTECTGSPYTAVFSSLRSVGILPVVAAGNSAADLLGFTSGVAAPACATGALRVGAVYSVNSASDYLWSGCEDRNPRVDQIACFSQGGPLLSLLAPGIDITAAGVTESGTSQAAPHVAGAIADLAVANPSATPAQIVQALTSTGSSVTDVRDNNRVFRRLDIAAAANAVQCRSPLGAAAAPSSCPSTAPGTFSALTPSRLLDTRYGVGAAAGPVGASGSLSVQVLGRGGVPAGGISAVTLNVTAVAPTGSGYLTVWPSGAPRPHTSNLNFYTGRNTPNAVVVPVGADGKVNLFNGSGGTVQLLADVSGYDLAGVPSAAGAFTAVPTNRVLDTRSGTGAVPGPVPGLGTLAVQIAGRGGVPVGASAVAVNLTAVAPAGSGYLTAWPSGRSRPVASNINFSAARNISNLAIVPIGTDGKINLFNGSVGTVQLVADVAGYFLGGGTPTLLGAFQSLAPNRLLDTRTSNGASGPVRAQGVATFQITGRGGVPVTGVTAVVLTVTVAAPTAAGYLTVWPSGQARPRASNLNFVAGQNVANTVVVPLGVGGKVDLFNGSGGSLQLLADVAGYYLAG